MSCTTLDKCVCAPKQYEGDGKASTTYYTSGESPGIGSCGGCLYPACPNCGGPSQDYNYENMFTVLQKIRSDIPWTMGATAESMMGSYCPASKGMGCVGRSQPQGNTADAPCGTCWELTNPENQKINMVITDACPYEDNKQWCPKYPGDKNQSQYYNHFDVWNGNKIKGWGDNPLVTFRSIVCPPEVRQIIREGCCGTYYDGSQGGSPQGCPNICGSEYQCPPALQRKRHPAYQTLAYL